MKNFLLLIAVAALFAGCRKKPLPVPVQNAPAYGDLRLAFRNVMNGENLQLNSKTYVTAAGDSITVSAFKYFISNIELIDANGNAMKPEPTYNVIDQGPSGSRIASAEDFRPGTYTKVRFLIGVDSARNVSGAQEGDLDPAGAASGMFWDWLTGYIMAKVEGTSPQSAAGGNFVAFHMGGFSGRHNVLRTVTLDLPSPAIIREGRITELHIDADLAEWFKTPNTIRMADVAIIMAPGADAMKVADNYTDMFRVTEVHNE